MLLGAHPQIATVGEMKLPAKAMGDLVRYRCSCGTLIRKCAFWQQVKEGMAARGFEFDLAHARTDYRAVESRYARCLLGPMHRGRFLESVRDMALDMSLTWRRRLPEIQKHNVALASTVLEITKAEVIIDSSKNALRLKYLLRNPRLNIQVIRLIRDGRAVALTYMDPARFADAQEPSRRGGGMGKGRENQRLPMVQAAYSWRRCMEEAESVLRCLAPTQWTEVRYEEYCKAPETVAIRLCQFLGVEPDMPVGNFRGVEQHIVGNGMRLNATSEVHMDERWRDALTEQDLGTFDSVAGEMNRRYGYR